MAEAFFSQAEAERLLTMLKNSLAEIILFPPKGKRVQFKVEGDTPRDIFTVSINRGKIAEYKCSYCGQIEKGGTPLLELHVVSPNSVHPNPDGEKITGSHWHIYTEEYGRRLAVPIDLNDKEFVENSIAFFKRFNIIKQPLVQLQLEMA